MNRTAYFRVAVVMTAGLAVAADAVKAQLGRGAEHEAIAYSKSTPTDPIARLQQRIDSGAVTLTFDPTWGYLPAVLKALDVPVSSQGLVFSKTSLQVDRIGPWAPRALYFNDDVYLGWVQGGPIMEVASIDPKLGTVFYSLPQDPEARPRFVREGSTCLICHDSASVTGGVPGLIVRSVIPDRHGYALGSLHDGSTTDGTPINARWGGWYATGTGPAPHMGNVMAPALSHEVGNMRQYVASAPLKPVGSVARLDDRFDTTAYLSGGHSDMVGLLILSHQARVHNLITIAGYEARIALHEELARTGSADVAAARDNTRRRVKGSAEPLVRAMLFADEVALAGAIHGSSSFVSDFEARGPRDARGRTLRELDLQQRLFTYPLSYLIYSEAFNALPEIVKSYVYHRLHEVLSGSDTSVAQLSDTQREAILEILDDTKPDFVTASTDSGP
ncbi:MAG: hypothetical protein EHM55_13530 [Acidobacteria bacterium]|nr:MAG: hypothetical protein EHM55_13530 [Acidobacteriota bacterium]